MGGKWEKSGKNIARWQVHHLLSELYSPSVLNYPITIHGDNRSTIELIKNTTFHSHTKHIAIHYHYICEAFNNSVIALNHCGTDNMSTDMFTKVLVCVKLSKFAQSVGVFLTWGGMSQYFQIFSCFQVDQLCSEMQFVLTLNLLFSHLYSPCSLCTK